MVVAEMLSVLDEDVLETLAEAFTKKDTEHRKPVHIEEHKGRTKDPE